MSPLLVLLSRPLAPHPVSGDPLAVGVQDPITLCPPGMFPLFSYVPGLLTLNTKRGRVTTDKTGDDSTKIDGIEALWIINSAENLS